MDLKQIKQIIDLLLKRLREQMAEHKVTIELTEAAKEMLVGVGYDPAMGARPLRRAIQRHIEDPLADFVLGAELMEGGTLLVDRKDGAENEVSITILPATEEPVEPEKVTVPPEEPKADADEPASDE